ncbi:MAG: beta-class carbonic anhydrase [Phycisphaeraceae bacterium]|jgi:carbonic anhydrase
MPASDIDQALAHNASYAQSFTHGELAAPPTRKLIVVTCMDARIDVEDALGLAAGEAHILRNAGGSVTDDVLRSAIVSTNALGTRQIMVINHTKCGMMGCTDHGLREQLTEQYGPADNAPADFHAFTDSDTHVREQVAKLTGHPWIPSDTIVRGFTYDVQTGQLHEVDCG